MATCRACREDIRAGASVCRHCQQGQGWLAWHVGRWFTPAVSVLTALVAVASVVVSFHFSSLNLQEASRERIAAQDAVTKAKAALVKAEDALEETKRIAAATDKLAKEVKFAVAAACMKMSGLGRL